MANYDYFYLTLFGASSASPFVHAVYKYPVCYSTYIPLDQHIDVRFTIDLPGVIDLSKCYIQYYCITAGYDGSIPPSYIYTASAFTSDWVGVVTPYMDPITTLVGYQFVFYPDGWDFPASAALFFIYHIEAVTGEYLDVVCPLYTVPKFNITSAELIGLNKLRINFNNKLLGDSEVTDVSNWSIRPIPGNSLESYDSLSSVNEVAMSQETHPTWVVLDVTKLREHQRYELACGPNIKDIYGKSLIKDRVSFEARKTSLDNLNSNMHSVLNTYGFSNIATILTAIGRELENFLGYKGTIKSKNLKNLR